MVPTIPGYDDLTKIGTGGYADVYRARAAAFDRDVAVKVLSRHELEDRATNLFERDRVAMETLSAHPNIVTIYDADLADGIPYLVMEYLPDGSLGDRLEGDGAMAWEEAISIGVKLAGALEAAHRVGLLHCDVKPENVFVDSDGEPQLGDFGVLRTVDLTGTNSNDRSLSVPYAAPEILNGADPSVASDVYSLGATIFALIAGRPPFFRHGDTTLLPHLARIANEAPPDLRVRDVPAPLCRALEHALAKSPSDRPATALALGEELQQVQRELGQSVTPIPVHISEEIRTAPPPPSPRAPAPSRRRRWPIGVAAAVTVVAATAVAVSGGGEDPELGEPVVAGVTQTRPPEAFTALPADAGPLSSGLYRTRVFEPAVRFAVGDGWRLDSSETTNVVDLARAGAPATDRFSLVSVSGQPAPSLVAWLRSHPRLSTGEPVTRPLGTLEVTEIDVSVTDGSDWDGRSAGFSLAGANVNRVYVFDISGTTVVGVVGARQAGFTDLATEAEQILASVQPA